MSTAATSGALAGAAVADAMSPSLLMCAPSTPVRVVAATMVEHAVHAVVLSDASDGSPAMVTDLGVVGAAGDIGTADAAAVADATATVAPGDPLIGAAAAMSRESRSHVLVLDPGSRRPVGLLSTYDIAAALAGRDVRAARAVRRAPTRPVIGTSRLDRVAVALAMHPGVFACSPDASLREVASIIVDRQVHCVAVPGTPGPASWKFVTDLSVARAAAEGRSVSAFDLVGEAVWIAPDAMLDEAAALMVDKRTSHLLVRGHHHPMGVLSTLDVIGVIAGRAT